MIYKSLGMPKYPIIYKKFENELKEYIKNLQIGLKITSKMSKSKKRI